VQSRIAVTPTPTTLDKAYYESSTGDRTTAIPAISVEQRKGVPLGSSNHLTLSPSHHRRDRLRSSRVLLEDLAIIPQALRAAILTYDLTHIDIVFSCLDTLLFAIYRDSVCHPNRALELLTSADRYSITASSFIDYD
jgi:hypothetical protein